MTRPPSEDPEGRKKEAEGPSTPFVIPADRLRAALEDAQKQITPADRKGARNALDDEERSLNLEKEKARADTLTLQNNELAQNTELRRNLAERTIKIVCFWLLGVLVVVLLSGFDWPSRTGALNVPTFSLSDGALIALLTTTTVNVIGLLLTITLNLFPPKK
jgi:ferric-dicitrate binding protein FerR (iron transport regulator)